MTPEKFEELVKRVERKANENPKKYHLRVVSIALLGNLYYGIIVGSLLAALVAIGTLAWAGKVNYLTLKACIVLLPLVWMFFKSSWVPTSIPDGYPIAAADSPALFEMIDGLINKLDAKKIDQVFISDDFNAGVTASPRLGPFGGYRRYLTIGLPLMYALSPTQLQAVIAHELGHLTKGHGKTGNWVYRQRMRWTQLLAAFDARGNTGSFLVRPFLRWYGPYLSGYSFPLARAQEYEADAVSTTITSAPALSQALSNVQVGKRILSETFWLRVQEKAKDTPLLNVDPYTDMTNAFVSFSDSARIDYWLENALQAKSDLADTHPAYPDRLKAIGQSAVFHPPPVNQSSALLLGQSLLRLVSHFTEQWRGRIDEYWKELAEAHQKKLARYNELNEMVLGNSELSLDDVVDYARLAEEFDPEPTQVIKRWTDLYQQLPHETYFKLKLGGALLRTEPEKGMALIEQSIEEEPINLGALGTYVLGQYLLEHKRFSEASLWQQRHREYQMQQTAAEQERDTVTPEDALVPHGLAEEELEEMVTALRKIKGLTGAFFVQKRCTYRSTRPMYILGILTTTRFRGTTVAKIVETRRACAQGANAPGPTLVLSLDAAERALRDKIMDTPGGQILGSPWTLYYSFALTRLFRRKR
jgi:Zn-dependent protease with chaperone function